MGYVMLRNTRLSIVIQMASTQIHLAVARSETVSKWSDEKQGGLL